MRHRTSRHVGASCIVAWLLLAGAGLMVPGLARADPAPGHPGLRSGLLSDQSDGGDRRDDLRRDRRTGRASDRRGGDVDRELAQTMEKLMVLRLSKHLELDDAQKERVIPLIKQMTRARRDYARQRRDALRALMAMSSDPGTDEQMIRQRLASFHDEEAAFRRDEEEIARQLRTHLDVRQQARLLAFQERFRDEMRRRIEDVRRGRGAPGGVRDGRRRDAEDRRPSGRRPR